MLDNIYIIYIVITIVIIITKGRLMLDNAELMEAFKHIKDIGGVAKVSLCPPGISLQLSLYVYGGTSVGVTLRQVIYLVSPKNSYDPFFHYFTFSHFRTSWVFWVLLGLLGYDKDFYILVNL